MNRIQQWADVDDAVSEPADDLEGSSFEAGQMLLTTSDVVVPHSLFVPLHYEKKYAYPLIVWLHGPGDNEDQLRRIMPHVSMRNYVAVGPRGTVSESGDDRTKGRYCWQQEEDHVLLAEQHVLESIELARKKCRIAASRVFLAGYDCGGTMAFRIGMNHPDRFAGVLSFGGPFPSGDRPLLRIEQARRLPLFIAHGRDSVKYPEHQVCQHLRLFHTAGMSVTLRQYPASDEISTQMLSDMDAWIMEQVTGVESTSGELCFPPPGEVN